MKQLLSFIAVLAFMNVYAQSPKQWGDMVTANSMMGYVNILASDEFEGRETGTEGQRKAGNYIENHFSSLGLLKPKGINGHQQLYPLKRDTLLSTTLTVNGTPATFGVDYMMPLLRNSNSRFKSNKLVFAGYGIADPAYDDYANINVKGKVIIIFEGEPKRDGKYFLGTDGKISRWSLVQQEKLQTAAAKGAVGVLIINPSAETFSQRAVESGRRTALGYRGVEGKIAPQAGFATISHAFAKSIMPVDFAVALATAKNKETFNPQPTDTKTDITYEFKKTTEVVNASNVLGVLEGTDKKDEYLFITGHYDHLGKRNGKIYYGADDDGSGTAAVMEMARVFKAAADAGQRPRRTIVFMTVSGEEKGLWGSEYYSDNPIYSLDKTTADLNIDMIGRIDTERKNADTMNYVYVIGHDKLSTELPIINEGMNNQYTQMVLDYKFDDPNDPNRIYYRSDHYNFARKGVPILFFYDGMLKSDYHQPTDTPEKITRELYEKRARMIFYTAWEMANRDGMVKRDLALPTGVR